MSKTTSIGWFHKPMKCSRREHRIHQACFIFFPRHMPDSICQPLVQLRQASKLSPGQWNVGRSDAHFPGLARESPPVRAATQPISAYCLCGKPCDELDKHRTIDGHSHHLEESTSKGHQIRNFTLDFYVSTK